jgi:hypothetical protein
MKALVGVAPRSSNAILACYNLINYATIGLDAACVAFIKLGPMHAWILKLVK